MKIEIGVPAEEGAFSALGQAVDRISEARRAVSDMAAALAGELPEESRQGSNKIDTCGGSLGDLYRMADALRDAATEILVDVDRIRRHAN